MVPRTARKQITLFTFSVILIAGLALYARVPEKPNVYKARGEALDLQVVGGIEEADKGDLVTQAKAVIVPHHLVSAQSIALGIRSVAVTKPRYVIVLSPDHFHQCRVLLCTTEGTFDTFYGNLPVSSSHIRTLLRSPRVEISSLFKEEHGVYSIAPFIKRYLPEAEIIPLVVTVSTRGTADTRKDIIDLLFPLVSRDDVALVISSDFSHYLPLDETLKHDQLTQNSFCGGKSDELLTLKNPSQSDCPLCLWILHQLATTLDFWNPTLLSHTNSAELLNDLTAQEITSHYTFALSKERAPPGSCPTSVIPTASSTVFLFVGDMMFDRYIRTTKNRHGEEYLLSCIDPLLKRAEIIVGNLEGPITREPSTSEGTAIGSKNNYRFTFPPDTASLLKRYNIGIVNIGNNHITDFGYQGLLSTKQYLRASNIAFFGGIQGDSPIHRLTSKGVDYSFVSYNQFGGEPTHIVASQIKQEHDAGRKVIVYTHWGAEYVEPTSDMKEVARLFTDSGADLIIGSHPHVIQSSEMLGNTPVYYSLGNFIFDQYFDTRVTRGLALLVAISQNAITIEEVEVTLQRDGRTCPTP